MNFKKQLLIYYYNWYYSFIEYMPLMLKLILSFFTKHVSYNIKKCEFCVQKIKYLNLIIIVDEIKMNFEKIAAIMKWETFNSVKKVQVFLKFVNFYRRFIRKFNKITNSLNDFIYKNRTFK